MSTNKSVCPNCNAVITCGCQRRKSINNTDCCSRCVNTVNERERRKARVAQS